MSVPSQLMKIIDEELSAGSAHFGDIGTPNIAFQDYVWTIVCKHLGDSPPGPVAIEFARKLYLRDLYLACGCVLKNERAWQVLDSSYRKFVADLVRFCYRNGTDAEEVADSVLVSLYLPDRSGRSRIASYDGRSSLATWLRVIVINRAINEKHNKRINQNEIMPDLPDHSALASIELSLRAERYKNPLKDSVSRAFQELTSRERLMLLWRYEENFQLGEIAHLLGIHQSNVTRQLIRLQARIKERITAILSSRHHLSDLAIQECMTDIVENPCHAISLVSLIKDAPKPAAAAALVARAQGRRS